MSFLIRDIQRSEYEALGALMVSVYSTLEGFPTPKQQPAYYDMLQNIGRLSEQADTRVLVAVEGNTLLGGVVFFSHMKQYGSGGTATNETDASGIRLLAVNPNVRGKGVGKAITFYCIEQAKNSGHKHVVLHTTKAMKVAWAMYENLGFKRAPDLDFMQQELPVFGFRLKLFI